MKAFGKRLCKCLYVRFLARLPANLNRVPRMLLGLYFTGIRNRDKTLSLGWALERAAARYPQRPAVMDETRSLTYAEFNAWAKKDAPSAPVPPNERPPAAPPPQPQGKPVPPEVAKQHIERLRNLLASK